MNCEQFTKKLNSVNKLHLKTIFVNKRNKYVFYYVDKNNVEHIIPKLPTNGIYVMFENGEKYKDTDYDRIVRIGINRLKSSNTLSKRLKSHYKGPIRNSTFRRHIKNAMEKSLNFPDTPSEKDISTYIQNNISFVILEDTEDTKGKREDFEESLIRLVYDCKDSKPSEKWLGKSHTDEIINKGNLWNNYELRQKRTPNQLKDLEKMVKENNIFDTFKLFEPL